MSRKCDISGKKQMSGMRYSFLRSHYNPTAKRKFNVNLQTLRTTINGKKVKLKVAAKALKSLIDVKSAAGLTTKKRSLRRQRKLIAKITESAS